MRLRGSRQPAGGVRSQSKVRGRASALATGLADKPGLQSGEEQHGSRAVWCPKASLPCLEDVWLLRLLCVPVWCMRSAIGAEVIAMPLHICVYAAEHFTSPHLWLPRMHWSSSDQSDKAVHSSRLRGSTGTMRDAASSSDMLVA